ncbi:MAG: glycoside hydrolase family 43 [Anaerolineae bacterium]|nr:MAG: glycoside hydrolase family 43 [Anaerolineae bacterium]
MRLSPLFFLAFALLTVSAACSPLMPPAQATSTPSPDVPMFQNPVLRENFADPFILQVGETFYAYATNSASKNISLARSTDLVKWQILPDAMPALPRWAKLTGGLVWAPEVIQIGNQFVLYYTARDKQSDKQCVGVAVSDKPEGKFKDTNDAPLVCQAEWGGTIDASPFRDEDGKLYLYYKNDGNCCNLPTFIYVQELAPDGLRLLGEPVSLIRNDALWEGRVVEAPTMFKHQGRYYLFFSANNYAGHEYAVGYALCESPLGPCQDAPENPILQSDLSNKDALVIGPGHQALLQLGEQTWMFYHAWEVVAGSRRGERRLMWLDRLDWVDGKPVVRGPTTGSQSVPLLP